MDPLSLWNLTQFYWHPKFIWMWLGPKICEAVIFWTLNITMILRNTPGSQKNLYDNLSMTLLSPTYFLLCFITFSWVLKSVLFFKDQQSDLILVRFICKSVPVSFKNVTQCCSSATLCLLPPWGKFFASTEEGLVI